jgi:hypothetical protein
MTHPEPNRGLAERSLRPDHLSGVRAVQKHWSESDQLNRAVANIRAVVTVLSDARRNSSPDFLLSVYKGWRVVECKRRGSRFCVLASKRVVGMARQTLIEQVWQNADDPTKRVVMCTHYTRFSVVTSKKVPLDNTSCAFYSEELHEFPSPFLCRSFTSIHGIHNDGEDWYYVKHSIDGKPSELEGHGGAEIVGYEWDPDSVYLAATDEKRALSLAWYSRTRLGLAASTSSWRCSMTRRACATRSSSCAKSHA